jgi:hypothetical protein
MSEEYRSFARAGRFAATRSRGLALHGRVIRCLRMRECALFPSRLGKRIREHIRERKMRIRRVDLRIMRRLHDSAYPNETFGGVSWLLTVTPEFQAPAKT